MHKLFISRNISPDSPLRAWAADSGTHLTGYSYIRFAAVRFEPPTDADWWFFYSPRAVTFAASRLALLPIPLPRLAAIGSGTARALRAHDYVLEPDFVGAGSPAEVAQAFARVAAGQTVFFPRARQSRRSVQRLLPNSITVLDAVCYDNQPIDNPAYVDADTYVFTSPLNARTYLTVHPLPDHARVVAIGPSTAQALASVGVRCEVAVESSEAGILDVLKQPGQYRLLNGGHRHVGVARAEVSAADAQPVPPFHRF